MINSTILTVACAVWAGYHLLTGQPVLALEVVLGLAIFLGIKWALRKLFGLDKRTAEE